MVSLLKQPRIFEKMRKTPHRIDRSPDTNKLLSSRGSLQPCNSYPDVLGSTVLNQLSEVDDWPAVKGLAESIVPIHETRKLGQNDEIFQAELRRHYPDLKTEFRAERQPSLSRANLQIPARARQIRRTKSLMKRPRSEIKSGQAPTAKGSSGSCNRGIKKLRTFGKFAAYSFWSGRQDCFALFVFSGRNVRS